MVPLDWGDSIFLLFLKRAKYKMQALPWNLLIYIAAQVFASVRLHQGMAPIDKLFVLRQTLEHRAKHQKLTVSVFKDFIAAFDFVLWDGTFGFVILTWLFRIHYHSDVEHVPNISTFLL